jgi:hypothetical protein
VSGHDFVEALVISAVVFRVGAWCESWEMKRASGYVIESHFLRDSIVYFAQEKSALPSPVAPVLVLFLPASGIEPVSKKWEFPHPVCIIRAFSG